MYLRSGLISIQLYMKAVKMSENIPSEERPSTSLKKTRKMDRIRYEVIYCAIAWYTAHSKNRLEKHKAEKNLITACYRYIKCSADTAIKNI